MSEISILASDLDKGSFQVRAVPEGEIGRKSS